MSQQKGKLQCPIDTQKYITLRQKIITQGLLTKETIWALLYQMTSVFDVAERSGKRIHSQINLDYFYVPHQIDTSELFFSSEIYKESQFYQSQLVVLKNLFLEIGINPKDVHSFQSFDDCYSYFLTKLNIKKCQERLILEQIFGFKILDVLFDQQFTKVFEIEKPFYIESNRVIVKWVKQEQENEKFNEIEIFSQMERELFKQNRSHRLINISQIFCFTIINSQEFIIIQERYWKTLSDFIEQFFSILQVSDKMKICLSLTHALEAIHQTKIIHRDIKPDNIMAKRINQSSNDKELNLENLEWLLIDYDKAAEKQATKNDLYTGTQDYRPPELVENNQFNEAYDIWQLGMCFLFLMTGRKLAKYAKQTRPYPQDKYFSKLQGEYDLLSNDQKKQMYSPTMHSLIKKMTSYNPRDRPSLGYVKEQLHKKLID